MALDSEVKVLTERLNSINEKLSNLEKSINKLDENIEKFKDKIDNKIDQINEIKIPSITEELSALRAKAAVFGGVFGAIGSFVFSLALWAVQTFHR